MKKAIIILLVSFVIVVAAGWDILFDVYLYVGCVAAVVFLLYRIAKMVK